MPGTTVRGLFVRKDNKVYVIGHKNPDTDSICSAIAYADIKNRTTKGTYVAKRAGQINEETEFVLKYFHVPAPGYLPDVGTQVKDMDLHETPGAANSMSVKRAWKLMQEHNAVTLPITDKEGKVEGLITTGDIAKSYMDAYDNTLLAQARTQYRSIADTVDGQIIVGNEHGYFIKGKVVMGLSQPDTMESFIDEDDLVILGNRAEDQLCAIEANASCLIVCLGAKVGKTIQKLAEERNQVIISTPYDSFTVARLIHQSIPITQTFLLIPLSDPLWKSVMHLLPPDSISWNRQTTMFLTRESPVLPILSDTGKPVTRKLLSSVSMIPQKVPVKSLPSVVRMLLFPFSTTQLQ